MQMSDRLKLIRRMLMMTFMLSSRPAEDLPIITYAFCAAWHSQSAYVVILQTLTASVSGAGVYHRTMFRYLFCMRSCFIYGRYEDENR